MVSFEPVGSFWFFISLPCGRFSENFQPFFSTFYGTGVEIFRGSLLAKTCINWKTRLRLCRAGIFAVKFSPSSPIRVHSRSFAVKKSAAFGLIARARIFGAFPRSFPALC